jgi:uncharacterized OsmC-like protein
MENITMATQATLNRVNVDRLVETINHVKENPDLAKFEFRTKSRWEGGARTVTTIDSFYGAGSEQQHTRTHRLEGDEPDVLLGDDSGPNAVETVLAALASCLAVGYSYNAAAKGLEIRDLSFEIDGTLDLHAFLGLGEDTRPGYESIRVRYSVDSPASRAKLEELCDYVQRTSPVLDIIANKVPVSVELVD